MKIFYAAIFGCSILAIACEQKSSDRTKAPVPVTIDDGDDEGDEGGKDESGDGTSGGADYSDGRVKPGGTGSGTGDGGTGGGGTDGGATEGGDEGGSGTDDGSGGDGFAAALPPAVVGVWRHSGQEGGYHAVRILEFSEPCKIREKILAAQFLALDVEYDCQSKADSAEQILILTVANIHFQFTDRYYRIGDEVRCRIAVGADPLNLANICGLFSNRDFPASMDQARRFLPFN